MTTSDIRFRERRFDRRAIFVSRQQTWQEVVHSCLSSRSCGQQRNPNLSFLHKTAQAIRSTLFASATTATFWWVRANSCDNQTLSPGACLVRYCITTRAPCTNSLRRYEFPRLLMPSSFCLPPVEYSRGTIPTQAA